MELDGKVFSGMNDYNVILIIKVKIIIFEKIHDEGWFQLSTLNRRTEVL